MSAITHNNHYVPQFYLKNWSEDNNTIWVYSILVPDKRVPYWENKSIEYIAKWNDFYTRYNGAQETDDFEKWFNKEFESPAEPIINKMIGGKSLTRLEERTLSHYIFAQSVRVPAKVDKFLSQAKNAYDHAVNSLGKIKSLPKFQTSANSTGVPLPIKVSIDREKSEVEIKAAISKSTYLFAVKSLLTKTMPKVDYHHWHVIHAAKGISFPTSDNPVICMNYTNAQEYDFNGGWGKKNANIIFPLSPECLAFTEIGNHKDCSVLDYSEYWSKFFRKIIIEHAFRYVYANTRQRGMLAINPRIINKELFLAEKQRMSDWHEESNRFETNLLSK